MSGVSPTRPGSFSNTPPVEVAPASRPSESSATQPTVPWPSFPVWPETWPGAWLDSSAPARVNQASGSCTRASPCLPAKSAAPSPASITCGVNSITARAAAMGLSNPTSAATAPGPAARAVHQAGVQFVDAIQVGRGAAARHIQARRLQRRHRLHHHVQRRGAGVQPDPAPPPPARACARPRGRSPGRPWRPRRRAGPARWVFSSYQNL